MRRRSNPAWPQPNAVSARARRIQRPVLVAQEGVGPCLRCARGLQDGLPHLTHSRTSGPARGPEPGCASTETVSSRVAASFSAKCGHSVLGLGTRVRMFDSKMIVTPAGVSPALPRRVQLGSRADRARRIVESAAVRSGCRIDPVSRAADSRDSPPLALTPTIRRDHCSITAREHPEPVPTFPVSPRDHSISLSVRRRTDGGILIPSAVAVFMLITSSNRVGCDTGSSDGRAPFESLST
jgi:hypothetical protein